MYPIWPKLATKIEFRHSGVKLQESRRVHKKSYLDILRTGYMPRVGKFEINLTPGLIHTLKKSIGKSIR